MLSIMKTKTNIIVYYSSYAGISLQQNLFEVLEKKRVLC